MRPRWPHLPLGRSRQAVLDILGHIFLENLLTQHGPSHTPIIHRPILGTAHTAGAAPEGLALPACPTADA